MNLPNDSKRNDLKTTFDGAMTVQSKNDIKWQNNNNHGYNTNVQVKTTIIYKKRRQHEKEINLNDIS